MSTMISNPYAYFDKNSEYHHQNPVNDNSYDCQADYNAISVVGNSSGGLADNTSAYVPVLFSPDNTWPDCANYFWTERNYTW
jgi:hypothetical protein